MEQFNYKGSDGFTIESYKWLDQSHNKPKAIIQIVHGMAEHAARYDYFAKRMLDKGYFVYANDHRGHGKTAGNIVNTGHFADSNGWDLVVDDVRILTKIIREKHSGVPLILFGHSMGSFIARDYIIHDFDKIEGLILSGTSYNPDYIIALGSMIAGIQKTFKGGRHRSKFLDKLSFGNFNKSFRPNRTEFDWLSRDNIEVDKYINDPYCGFLCSTQFFNDLFYGLKKIHKNTAYYAIQSPLPTLVFSGERDPVGGFTKGVRKFLTRSTEGDNTNIDYHFYKDGRHEMLNEINKDEVIEDINKWIEENVANL